MNAFADMLALGLVANVVVATIVAAGASWALRLGRPRLAHALCVFGLLKLLTPPLVRVPVLPAPATTVAANAPDLLLATCTDVAAPTAIAPATADLASSSALAAALAAFGSLLMLGLVVSRSHRFRRLLRLGHPASRGLETRVRTLARDMRLRRCPRVLLVPARISPMLCLIAGRARIVLPEPLLAQLTPAQLDALLAHELAHAARGDHWVRALEVVVLCATWWLPTTWWLRRTLRRAEERCCDAHVLRTLPHQARVYADALLSTLDFLAAAPPAMPPVACGVSAFHDMKTRLKTIMNDPRTTPLPTTARAILYACAATLLPLAPTVAQKEDGPGNAGVAVELRAAKHELEQLRAELAELRASVMRERAQAQAEATTADPGLEVARAATEDAARQAAPGAAAAEHLAKMQEIVGDVARDHVVDVSKILEDVELAKVLDRTDYENAKRLHAARAGSIQHAAELQEHLAKLAKRALTRAGESELSEGHGLEEVLQDAERAAQQAAEQALVAHTHARDALAQAHQHYLQALAERETAASRTATAGETEEASPTKAATPKDDELRALRHEVRRLQERVEVMSRQIERKLGAAGGEARTGGNPN